MVTSLRKVIESMPQTKKTLEAITATSEEVVIESFKRLRSEIHKNFKCMSESIRDGKMTAVVKIFDKQAVDANCGFGFLPSMTNLKRLTILIDRNARLILMEAPIVDGLKTPAEINETKGLVKISIPVDWYEKEDVMHDISLLCLGVLPLREHELVDTKK